jgi:hypothetical protein
MPSEDFLASTLTQGEQRSPRQTISGITTSCFHRTYGDHFPFSVIQRQPSLRLRVDLTSLQLQLVGIAWGADQASKIHYLAIRGSMDGHERAEQPNTHAAKVTAQIPLFEEPYHLTNQTLIADGILGDSGDPEL